MKTEFEQALANDQIIQSLKKLLTERRRELAAENGLTSTRWFEVSCSRHRKKHIAESRLGGTEIKVFICMECTNERNSFKGDEERHVLSVPTIFGYFCPHGCGNVSSKPNQKTITANSQAETTTYYCVVCEKELGGIAQ